MGKGKRKKPSQSGYYLFVMEENEKASGGAEPDKYKAARERLRHKWDQLSTEDKRVYEKRAMETIQVKIGDLFQSFASENGNIQPMPRQFGQIEATEQAESFVHSLVCGPDLGNKVFIFMKASYLIKQTIGRNTIMHWPGEISLAAFSLKSGIKSVYTQIVDTGQVPLGYASEMLESCLDTLLPAPGDSGFSEIPECRDYLSILKNINGFINHVWAVAGLALERGKVVMGGFSLRFLTKLTHCLAVYNGEDRVVHQEFVDNLKVCSSITLVRLLTVEANPLDSTRDANGVQFDLETAAEALLKMRTYDYRQEIVCKYHRSAIAVSQSHNCAQSIVLRRIFLLFDELIPAFGYQQDDGHKIEKMQKVEWAMQNRDLEPQTNTKEDAKERPVCLISGDACHHNSTAKSMEPYHPLRVGMESLAISPHNMEMPLSASPCYWHPTSHKLEAHCSEFSLDGLSNGDTHFPALTKSKNSTSCYRPHPSTTGTNSAYRSRVKAGLPSSFPIGWCSTKSSDINAIFPVLKVGTANTDAFKPSLGNAQTGNVHFPLETGNRFDASAQEKEIFEP